MGTLTEIPGDILSPLDRSCCEDIDIALSEMGFRVVALRRFETRLTKWE